MEFLEKLKIITENLAKCERVTKYSTFEENQADTLGNALIDIEEALTKINQQIPKLYLKKLSEEEVDDIILEIGEELKHIIYHVKDSKAYNYLLEDV
jgi:hypothetical protein